jgi:tungstate transport system ATP-binding protein
MFPLRIHDLHWHAGGRPSAWSWAGGHHHPAGPQWRRQERLLRSLCGLIEPDAGIRLGWGPRPDFGVAMVFQQPKMLRDSVLGNVELALRPLRVRRPSGGRGRMRCWSGSAWPIGRATAPAALRWRASAPRPGPGVDHPAAPAAARRTHRQPRPSSVDAIERIVREIRTEGTRILMTTHNLGQAMRLADDVVFIDAGRVCEHAPVQRFFARPASQAARLYIQGELPWRMAF